MITFLKNLFAKRKPSPGLILPMGEEDLHGAASVDHAFLEARKKKEARLKELEARHERNVTRYNVKNPELIEEIKKLRELLAP